MSKFIRNRYFGLTLIILIVFAAAMIMNSRETGNNGNAADFDADTGETSKPTEYVSEPSQSGEKNTENTESEETTDVPIATEAPVKKNPRVYQDKFDRIREMYNGNTDIIGIVKIPGTVINYPVAHYDQDNDFYLNRNLYKQRSAAGSIFMDFENSVERYDPNTVLYGHQMSFNSMFHTISYYMDEDFFNNHRYIIFNTIYEDNVWEVFAFFKTHISFNYIKVYFPSEQNFLVRAAEIKERSIYDTGIEIKEGDRILTLSTCTNEDQDTRYVLSARLIKNKNDIPEEIAKQMTSAVDDYK